jgi:hypothetical protein
MRLESVLIGVIIKERPQPSKNLLDIEVWPRFQSWPVKDGVNAA